jgi:circadian clock protein KaiB
MNAPHDATPELPGDAFAACGESTHELTLFVNGASDVSARAIVGARELCDVQLGGRYRLSVVDVHDDPAAVLSNHVLVAPTLLKHWPLPGRRYVGDLSDTGKVLLALQLAAVKTASTAVG